METIETAASHAAKNASHIYLRTSPCVQSGLASVGYRLVKRLKIFGRGLRFVVKMTAQISHSHLDRADIRAFRSYLAKVFKESPVRSTPTFYSSSEKLFREIFTYERMTVEEVAVLPGRGLDYDQPEIGEKVNSVVPGFIGKWLYSLSAGS